MSDLFAIDPPGCACTDCILGESVPLDRATGKQVAAMLVGPLIDRNGTPLSITVSVTASLDGQEWDLTEDSSWRDVAATVLGLSMRVELEGTQ